ncbi:MAG: hypothetical protein ABWZ98_11065 [Nakamurella sp.]
MAGTGQDPPHQHRRRRRAARRAAGPPAVAESAPGPPLDAGPKVGAVADAVPVPSPPVRGPGQTAGSGTDGSSTAVGPGVRSPGGPAKGQTEQATGSSSPPHHSAEVHGSPGDAPEHAPPAAHAGSQSGGGSKEHSAAGFPASADGGRRPRSGREEAAERSLRSLVTTRSTQVSPTAALRAREVALPTAADLAEAEQELVIVRRHYVPPTTLAAGRRQEWPNRRGPGGKGANPSAK